MWENGWDDFSVDESGGNRSGTFPHCPEVGRPYYRARTNLDAPAIIEPDPEDGAKKGDRPNGIRLRTWCHSFKDSRIDEALGLR